MPFPRAFFALLFCALLAPLSARDEPTLNGDWLLDDAPNNLHYAFQSNGIFKAFNIADGKETMVISSKWRVEDDLLILFDMTFPVMERVPAEYKISFQDGDHLTILDERAQITTRWKKTAGPAK